MSQVTQNNRPPIQSHVPTTVETPPTPRGPSKMAKTAYDIAKLVPKLLLSGAGWAIGFVIGGNLGAGLGDALGTFIGSAVSFFVVEMLIGRLFCLDPALKATCFRVLAIDRLKSALILSSGCFLGGLVFNTALTKVAQMIVASGFFANLGKALITGAITAAAFVGGQSIARACFNGKNGLSRKNFFADLKTATWIILPAEAAFVATVLPLLGTTWLMGTKLGVIKAATSVLIGGEIGAISQKLWDAFYHKRQIERLSQYDNSTQ